MKKIGSQIDDGDVIWSEPSVTFRQFEFSMFGSSLPLTEPIMGSVEYANAQMVNATKALSATWREIAKVFNDAVASFISSDAFRVLMSNTCPHCGHWSRSLPRHMRRHHRGNL